MSKKQSAKKAVESIHKMKMPIIQNGPSGPCKDDYEKPSLSISHLRPVSPPPPERAIHPEQKQEVIQALLDAWLKFPYLRLGQLVGLASNSASPFYVEDSALKTALLIFDHQKIRCDSFSQSRSMQCTLEYGHDGDRHFNHMVGMAWRRY